MLESDCGLQLILPTDKRNPSLTLWRDDQSQTLHVYYGMEVMEVVPDDPEHAQYKLMVANLYNAGLKVAVLEEVFGRDRKTMKGWGEALRSGDARRLVQALEGRQHRRKLTAEIESFIRHRFAEVYRQHRRKYNVQLRQEVFEVFKVRLSGEAIRPILRTLRPAKAERSETGFGQETQGCSAAASASVGGGQMEGARSASRLEETASVGVVGLAGTPSDGPKPEDKKEEMPCELAGNPKPHEPSTRKPSPVFEPWLLGQTRWCDHVGVLLFWHGLIQILAVLKPPEPLLKQWLASVLLGAVNVEQTKFLNWEELSLLLGQVVRFPTPQRQALEQVACAATIQALLRWNGRNVSVQNESDFYLDPHTKHYTGMKPILKGWCPVIRWADKALHSDFLHTRRGEPVYFECADNFADLRERFWGVVERGRKALDLPREKVLTLTVDRGIYSLEVFEQILGDPSLHLITWEKGYVAGQWNESNKQGEFVIQRPRNRAQDVQTYHFKYLDRPWAKDARMRQLMVVGTNPQRRTIEVSVLTDDLDRPAVEVLKLIFNRWLQENDFKYLEKHFGINQITSYRALAYDQLAGQVQDRQVQSGEYKALIQNGSKLKHQQARWLIEQERADYEHAARKAQSAQLEKRLADPHSAASSGQKKDWTKQWNRLRLADQRYQKKRIKRREQIQSLNQQLQQNQQQLQTVKKEESRLGQMIDQGMQRLDTQNKQLMDAIKITARNLFRQALQPFKKEYDNYRDDHDYFRKLTQSGGVLRWTGQEFEVHLVPQVNYAPALRKVVENLLGQVNSAQPRLPDGSNRPLTFFLSNRSDFEIRLKGF